jgi:UDP-glucose 4-epimerase
MLQDLAQSDAAWSLVLLRYFNPVGAHPSGDIGENPQGTPNNLFPYVAQVAIGQRPELSIYGNDYPTPDGTCIRDYLHVVDLAKGHVKALEKVTTQPGVHIYNLGTGVGRSVLEVVAAFEQACGHAIPCKIVARRPGDSAACYADARLAAKELGWKAELTLEQMCQDAWRWQTMNPRGYE